MLASNIVTRLKSIVGDRNVLTQKEDLFIYSNDATIYSHLPEAVVRPAGSEEVAAVVKTAAAHNIPLTARGAGTCLSGGAVPLQGGIVIDLTRMNRIRTVDSTRKIIVAEAGAVTFDITAQAAEQGLLYPPDPSSFRESTIGGNVAECAGGPKGVKYGITRSYVLGVEAVLPDGSIVETGNAVDGDMSGPDWTMLLTGSEGTMAIITAATLRLVPAPETKKTMMALFRHLDDAAKTVSATMGAGIVPTTLELMDNLTIVAVEKAVKVGLPVTAGALLLFETDGVPSTVEENAQKVIDICRRFGAIELKIARTAAEAEELWVARRAVGKAFGHIAPSKFAEDATVPRSLVPVLIERLVAIGKKYNVPMMINGHAGDGNMHPTILFDKRDPEQADRAKKALDELHFVTLELGGTLSGEHGIGCAKASYLRAAVGATGYRLGQKVKATIDPQGIMNPGKMFNYEGELH